MATAENITASSPRVREYRGVDRAMFRDEIVARGEPAVMRELVKDWPAVAAAAGPADAIRAYLARFDRGAKVGAWIAPHEIGGRFFYRPDMSGLNFAQVETSLSEFAAAVAAEAANSEPRSMYMGSAPVPLVAPGFERENAMPLLDPRRAVPRIWVGTGTRIAAHYDESENVACVVKGGRRFTLFPTDQVANLYVGPLDFTPAGQPTSMVDLADPDFERFPRFREALKAALVADLEPGDAIYIPTLWWHHVQAPGAFNILVNYWWQDTPPDAGSPLHALGHGVLAIAHLPEAQRESWRVLFDHYVFRRNGDPVAHLPAASRGILAESTPQLRDLIRRYLVRMLGGR